MLRIVVCLACLGGSAFAPAAEPDSFAVTLRRQVPAVPSGQVPRPGIEAQSWDADRTAIIVCDMWDSHHCYRAVRRATELAPRMNRLLHVARDAGAVVIHAPSGCMDAYANHPGRSRAEAEPGRPDQPADINDWCHQIPAEEQADYPIDQTKGGEDDTPEEHAAWEKRLLAEGRDPNRPWKKQMDTLEIDADRDFISDRGDEIWAILGNRQVRNVLLVGVHTNMCVLGRPFGLRQLSKNGKNVALVRDMTDTMYDPAAEPFVSHFTGTDLIVRHIERHVCATISSDQLLGGEPFRFSNDRRTRVVMMIGESEYDTDRSLPEFALRQLGKDCQVTLVQPHPDDPNEFVGIEAIDDADVLLISVRRRTLPTGQLQVVRDFVDAGKPVIGLRTASHAFHLRGDEPPEGKSDWPEFDRQVFGGNYTNHHGNSLRSTVHLAAGAGDHPMVRGLSGLPFDQSGSLYKTSPLDPAATPLLVGRAEGVADEPVAWTFERSDGGRSFYTSLGHVKDFQQPVFNRMLGRAVRTLSEPSDSARTE